MNFMIKEGLGTQILLDILEDFHFANIKKNVG
jgi:hypothetical protein